MKGNIWNKHLNQKESGYMLITVILIITMISILGLSIISISMNAVKTSNSERNDQAVYYIAEAGITVKMEEIKSIINEMDSEESREAYFQKLNSTFSKIDNRYEDFEQTTSESAPLYSIVTIDENESLGDTRSYILTSTGNLGNQQRKLTQEFNVTWNDSGTSIQIPDFALFVKENIRMEGGASITGSIGTLKEGANTVEVSGGARMENGVICVPPGSEKDAVNKPDWMPDDQFPNATPCIDMEYYPELPPYPIFSVNEKNTENLTTKAWDKNSPYLLNLRNVEKMEINNLTVDGYLEIDTGDHVKDLVVKNFKIGEGYINVKGAGLRILIEDTFEINGGSSIKGINRNGKTDINMINIFYSGSSAINIAGDQKIFGSLYLRDADITLTGGSGFQGNIFTGGNSLKMTGGNNTISQLILAPNADVLLMGGAKIKGSIIANSFTSNGGANLEKNHDYPDPGSLNPVEGGSGGTGSITSIELLVEVDIEK